MNDSLTVVFRRGYFRVSFICRTADVGPDGLPRPGAPVIEGADVYRMFDAYGQTPVGYRGDWRENDAFCSACEAALAGPQPPATLPPGKLAFWRRRFGTHREPWVLGPLPHGLPSE